MEGVEVDRASQLFVRCSDAYPLFRHFSKSIQNVFSVRPLRLNGGLFVSFRSSRNRNAEDLGSLAGPFSGRLPFALLKDESEGPIKLGDRVFVSLRLRRSRGCCAT